MQEQGEVWGDFRVEFGDIFVGVGVVVGAVVGLPVFPNEVVAGLCVHYVDLCTFISEGTNVIFFPDKPYEGRCLFITD